MNLKKQQQVFLRIQQTKIEKEELTTTTSSKKN